MPTSAIEILTGVRDLLSDPERWTQGASARNVAGESVDLFSEDAVCFCAVGAFYRVSFPAAPDFENKDRDHAYWAARELLFPFLGDKSLVDLNDGDGREAVLDALDKAIGAAA